VNVAFLGIGRMGLPMATNILRAGFPLTVYNRTPERCVSLVECGARLAGNPAAAAAGADVLITMVADAAAADAVLAGPDGALRHLARGSIAIDMSTIGPVKALELAAAAREAGVDFLDAPVSGSTATAEAAQLATMVGGNEEAFLRALPVLEAMTKAQFHAGASGAGAAMKLGLNIIVALTDEAISECLALSSRSGIARPRAYEILEASAVASPFVHYKREAFLGDGDDAPAFTIALMEKDVALALELARSKGLELEAAAAALEVFRDAVARGHGDADIAGVLKARDTR
jgi:3-hydroxyisobutyrate dehydrogenase